MYPREYSYKMFLTNKTQYYVIIPQDLHIYKQFDNQIAEGVLFNSISCSIPNHKAFQYHIDTRVVQGIIISK